MEMLMVICDRTLTSKIIKLLRDEKMTKYFSFYGRGTADNEILSYFGLAKSEKEIIITFAEKEIIGNMINKLESLPHIKKQGAVAFSIPMDAINKGAIDILKEQVR